MNSKLTLKLDEEVISRAKQYAKKRNVSLSRLIETYLDAISGNKPGPIESTPLVKGLSGVIKLAEDFDYRKERGNQLERKHL